MIPTLIPVRPLRDALTRRATAIPEHIAAEGTDETDCLNEALTALDEVAAGKAVCGVCNDDVPASTDFVLYEPEPGVWIRYEDDPQIELPAAFTGICVKCRAAKATP